MKYTQIIFLLITMYFASCIQKTSSAFDPGESLDFNYSSILIEETTTIRDVAKKITGTWMGNHDWTNTINKKGAYILVIEHSREEFFTVTQKTMHKDKEVKSITVKATLLDMDGYYVLESGDKMIQINYLSDRQLKLGEHIFVRKNTK